jgi:hypothetical protein
MGVIVDLEPTIGGYIVDLFLALFFINIPRISTFDTSKLCKNPKWHEEVWSIDWLGIILLASSSAPYNTRAWTTG